MDETKIELPPWLPWATTACLAALVACLLELWIIERTRTQMLKDENLMSEATLKAAQNQLEAERIINRREIEELRASAGTAAEVEAMVMLPPGEDPADQIYPGHPWGAVTWNARTGIGSVKFVDLPALGAGRDYQFWIEGDGPLPFGSILVQVDPADPRTYVPIIRAFPLQSGAHFPMPGMHRFLLISTQKGGAKTLEAAKSEGSIILASPPQSPKIPN
jgi:hypothetical protein